MKVQPGETIAIEIQSQPTTAAAVKTLTRLCRKDPAVARALRQQYAKRPSQERWRRGGKMWHHQMRSAPGVQIVPGKRYQVRATLDVIRDLASVERFIRVSPA